MDDYLKCNICKEEDHEDQFCRCESRNIRIAKIKRELGQSPWTKSQENEENVHNTYLPIF